MKDGVSEPIQQALEEGLMKLLRLEPGIALSECVERCAPAFGASDVREAVNKLASAGHIRLESHLPHKHANAQKPHPDARLYLGREELSDNSRWGSPPAIAEG